MASFQAIYEDVLRGVYLDRYDAVKLAHVEINDRKEVLESAKTPRRSTEIPGLVKLSEDINALLHGAYIKEQGVVIAMKNSLSQSHHTIHQHALVSHSDYSELPIAESDSVVPLSEDEASSVLRGLKFQLQVTFDETVDVTSQKLNALEQIRNIYHLYTSMIAEVARECGLSEPYVRASHAVGTYCDAAIRHKYFDTSSVNEVRQASITLYSQLFLRRDEHMAQTRMQLNYQHSSWSEHHYFLLKLGAAVILLFWSISECINNERYGQDIWMDPTFTIFICYGDLILLLWMWGVSIYVWRTSGIDYLQLLQLQNTDFPYLKNPEMHVYSAATNLSIIYLVVFIIFNKFLRGIFSLNGNPAIAHAIPSCLALYFIYRSVLVMRRHRVWWDMLKRVLTAPMTDVIFRDGYVGDLLTSLVRVSISFSYSLFYIAITIYSWLSNDMKTASSSSTMWQQASLYRYLIVPFLTLIPLWLRLMQCLRRSLETGHRWPHYFNAIKYSAAICVLSFGIFNPHLQQNATWIFCLVLATMYQFYWDITMDWGLVKISPRGDISVRKEKVVSPSYVYVIVVALNFVLRFAWAVTLLPEDYTEHSRVYTYIFRYFQTLMAALEIVRRMVWGFYRLEYEQLETLGIPGVYKSFTQTPRKADGATMSSLTSMDIGSSLKDCDTRGHDDWTWMIRIPFVQVSLQKIGYNPSDGNFSRVLEATMLVTIVLSLVIVAATTSFHN